MHTNGRSRRTIATGLILALLASLLAVVAPATPAAAAGSQFLWLDEEGGETATYGPNAGIYISLGAIDYNCDTFYPVADVYVISGTPSDGGALTDVSGGVNVVFGSWGGGIIDELIAVTSPSGKLGEGTYSVVYDECQNGKFDANQDALFQDVITVDFPPGEIPPLSPAIAALKGQASTQATQWRAMLETYRVYLLAMELYETMQCLTGGFVSCAISMATDALQDAMQEQFMGMFGLQDPKEAAADVAEDLTRRYEGIRDDPPDPAFDTASNPELASDPLEPTSDEPREVAAVELANELATDEALAQSLLHAMERYQGADAADDAEWAINQARAARDAAELLAMRAPTTGDAMDALADAIEADATDLDGALAAYAPVRQRITTSGFTPDELAELRSRGLDDTEIQALIDTMAAQTTDPLDTAGLVATLRSQADGQAALATDLHAFTSDVDGVLDTLAIHPAAPGGIPTADAGGPYAAAAGANLVLDGSGSIADGGAIASYNWDVDLDGAFDDATGVGPTVTAPAAGERLIGLQVTDDDGDTDVSYAPLSVAVGNAPPVLVGTPGTPPGSVEVPIGSSQAFSVAATDADADPLTITWYLDAVEVGTGTDYTFGPTLAGQLGGHQVRAVATDGTSVRSLAWYPTVMAPDVDADTWHANVDCDDDDPAVHPLTIEEQGNGKDDDCDPATTDEVVNRAPAVSNLTVGTLEDTPIAITLPATDPEGDPITFEIVSPPATGSLGALVGNQVTYTPAPNATGLVTFTYRASDGELTSATRTITVTIAAVNDTPVAAKVTVVTPEDTPIPITLSGIDPDGSPITYQIISPPATGSLSPVSGDQVTYSPAPDASGDVTFTYRVTDGVENSPTAEVRVRILAVDDPILAADQATSTPEDTPVTFPLSFTDVDADPLTFVVVSEPDSGTVAIDAAGSATYTPAADVTGIKTFTWRVGDGTSWSAPAIATIDVTPVDDPPTAADVTALVSEDVPTTVVLSGSDPDADPLTYAIVTQPTNGTLSVVNGRRVIYTPGAEYAGPDSFTYRVSGAGVDSAPATATLTVTTVNDAPVALDDAAATSERAPITVDVLANDTDIDDATLKVVGLGTPTAGSANVTAGGQVRFVPPVDFVGPAHIDMTIGDGRGGTATSTLTVLVTEAAVPGSTWTSVDEFSTGDAFNVEQLGPNSLKINDEAEAFNRLWVAVSITRGTVVKFDTQTGAILGEYYTSPTGQPKNPSRTTVDLNGNVWATSRDGNSVVKIGLVENGQCEDRNSNGVIDTSTGQSDIRAWDNAGGVDTDGGVDTAADECILHYVKVRSSGTRHVSVTPDNDIWVSGTGAGPYFDLVDGETGVITRQEGPVGYGGYGGLIDSHGVVWSATSGPGALLRWDTSQPLSGPQSPTTWQALGGNPYGLCIDPNDGSVWGTSLGGGVVRKYAPDGTIVGTFSQGMDYAQGCAVDQNGDVWVAHSLYRTTVGHLKGDGTFVGNVQLSSPSGPTGVSVDADGNVWATNYNSGTVQRINATLGAVGADGETAIGEVDFTSPYLFGQPYNYSDMTGSTLTGSPQSGTWTATYDGGEAGVDWEAVSWRETSACGTTNDVAVASSEDGIAFTTASPAPNGGPLTVADGRYLKVTVTITRCPTGESDTLRDLTVWAAGPQAPDAEDTQTTTPEDTPVLTSLEGDTLPTPGGALTYEVVKQPGHGSIGPVAADGSFTYTPDADYVGFDSVGFRVDDGTLNSSTAFTVIDVTPINDPPTSANTSANVLYETPGDVTMPGDDVDGDDLTFTIVTPPTHGALGTTGPDGVVTYTPAAGYIGPDSFTYNVSDGTETTATYTASITVGSTVPGPPIDVSAIGGDSNARVQWEVPLTDGGSPITGYELQVVGGATYDVGNVLSFLVPGLVNDTEYTFTVRARNVNGYGPVSAASNVAEPRPSCTTSPFTDVGPTHPFCPEITWMAVNGVANGYADGSYKPLANVTRQAMTAFVYRLAGSENGPDPSCTVRPFSDVPTSHDFCGEIAWAKAEGIATGYADGTFKPGVAISRQAMASYLYKLTGSPRGPDPQCIRDEFTDVRQSNPFCGEIDWMVDMGITGGFADGSFKPTAAITRQAMAAFIFRYNILTGIIDS